jgi:methionyl-tRNA formyltransferase
MKIVWLSANKFGFELLKEAVKIKEIDVMAVITLSKESSTMMYDGVDNRVWSDFGIYVIEVDNLNEEKKVIEELSPDLVVMCGWRQIIKKDVISIPKKGFVGFHPTLLPIGRGVAPIINSILNGFKESGVSMFYVSEGLDDGDLIGQESFVIEENDHASEVYDKVVFAGKNLIRKFIPRLVDGTAPRIRQDNSKATFFEKPRLVNKICLDDSLDVIHKKIRAVSKPYDGAYLTDVNGRKLLLWRAEIGKGQKQGGENG